MKTINQQYTTLAHNFIASKKLRDASASAYSEAKNAIVESLSKIATETKEAAIITKELATFTEPDYGLFQVTGTYMKPGLRLNKKLLMHNLAKRGMTMEEIDKLLLESSKSASPRLELEVVQVRRSYDKAPIIIKEDQEESTSTSSALKSG